MLHTGWLHALTPCWSYKTQVEEQAADQVIACHCSCKPAATGTQHNMPAEGPRPMTIQSCWWAPQGCCKTRLPGWLCTAGSIINITVSGVQHALTLHRHLQTTNKGHACFDLE